MYEDRYKQTESANDIVVEMIDPDIPNAVLKKKVLRLLPEFERSMKPRHAYCWPGVCVVGVFSSVLAIALSSAVIAIGVGAILLRLFSRVSSTSGTDCNSRFFDPDNASSRSDSLLSLSRRPMFGIPLTELLALWLPPCP